jgi:hypothetical protein
MDRNAASEFVAPATGAGQWPSPPDAENIMVDTDSRLSPLISLIVLVLFSLGSWAAIWAAFASLSQR